MQGCKEARYFYQEIDIKMVKTQEMIQQWKLEH
jgi:hypothetical protein